MCCYINTLYIPARLDILNVKFATMYYLIFMYYLSYHEKALAVTCASSLLGFLVTPFISSCSWAGVFEH